MATARTLSTAENRQRVVVDAAITVFARDGYHVGTIAAVGAEAGISPAYVFKLAGSKTALFVAALDACFERILAALNHRAEMVASRSPATILLELGGAYAELIADRNLLMLQVHAQSACAVPEITAALRRGMGLVTELARSRSGATPDQVQAFIARGQLCHLLVATATEQVDASWARVLDQGIRHP